MKPFNLQSLPLVSLLLISACGGVKLIDLPKSPATLNLSEEQQQIIHPKITFIHDIVADYNFEKSELEAAYHRYQGNASLSRLSPYEGGGSNRDVVRERNMLRTKIRNFVRQRKEYTKEIAGIVEEIKTNLSPEQLAVFETDIKLPELELPRMLKKRTYEGLETIPYTRMGRPDDF